MKALYSYADESGDVKIMVGTHVDDIIWACKPEAEHMIAEIIEKFQCGEPEVGNFRYCGKEVVQDDHFNIHITCKDTTLKMEPIRIAGNRKASQVLNDQERTQMKSIAGSLSWIARNCRPDIAYGVSKVHSRSLWPGKGH